MLTFLKQGDLARGEGWWGEGAAGGPIPGPRGPGPQAAGPGAPQRAGVGGQQPRSKQPWRRSLQRAVVRARLCERLSGETCTPASGAGLPLILKAGKRARGEAGPAGSRGRGPAGGQRPCSGRGSGSRRLPALPPAGAPSPRHPSPVTPLLSPRAPPPVPPSSSCPLRDASGPRRLPRCPPPPSP